MTITFIIILFILLDILLCFSFYKDVWEGKYRIEKEIEETIVKERILVKDGQRT